MSDDTTQMRNFLAQHPKMTGVLFTILLLLTQAGSAMAGNGTIGTCGP
jgi:hypothetical protein